MLALSVVFSIKQNPIVRKVGEMRKSRAEGQSEIPTYRIDVRIERARRMALIFRSAMLFTLGGIVAAMYRY
jgi:hypothetical protein